MPDKKGIPGTWEGLPVTWYRASSGSYEARVQPPKPAEADRLAHARTIHPKESLLRGKPAPCYLCKVNYARLPSQLDCVREHGVCGLCLLYIQGKFDGIAVTREPTVEEILNRIDKINYMGGGQYLTVSEQIVVVRALKEARKTP